MEALEVGSLELLSVRWKENGAGEQRADAPPENAPLAFKNVLTSKAANASGQEANARSKLALASCPD